MTDKQKFKVPKTYSLDPVVIAWVSQRAARLAIEDGERANDSKLVNDILTAAMKADIRQEEARRQTVPHPQTKRKNNHAAQPVAA